jgi:hypothetical protein
MPEVIQHLDDALDDGRIAARSSERLSLRGRRGNGQKCAES